MLQLPNQIECKQNCTKSDPRGAPLIAREDLCSPLTKSGTPTPAHTRTISNNSKAFQSLYLRSYVKHFALKFTGPNKLEVGWFLSPSHSIACSFLNW